MSVIRARGVALIGALVLTACAHLPGGDAKRPDFGAAEAFELMGRMAVRYGTSAFSGTLRWRHEPDRDEVWLGGPLGQTGAHVLRNGRGAVLTTADGQVLQAGSLDALTRRGLGWTLPLADLSFYVLGLAPPEDTSAPERRYDDAGRLRELTRDGWRVTLDPAAGNGSARHPGRLLLTKEEVEIRLVIDALLPAEP